MANLQRPQRQHHFHDILPATGLLLRFVLINRHRKGVAQTVEAQPTWTYSSMAELAAAVTN